MSTSSQFFVKWNYTPHLLEMLTELSGTVSRGFQWDYPRELIGLPVYGDDIDPTLLIVQGYSEGWEGVEVNSSKKLHDWGAIMSAKFNTTFIQIMHNRQDHFYYFLMYEKGELRREIAVDHLHAEKTIDTGGKFPFESPILFGIENEVDDLPQRPRMPAMDCDCFDEEEDEEADPSPFGLDTLVDYCKEFNLDLADNREGGYYYPMVPWRRPWWRFW